MAEPDPPPKPAEAAPAESEPEPAPAPAASGSAAADSGSSEIKELTKEELKPGKGTAAKVGDTVRVHYTGTLLDGTEFDSSRGRAPFEFELGAGMVIQGWDEGVVGMKAGGKRKLTIPADKAYGKQGRPPKIPPNSPLVFQVELVEIL